jgi:hypothetical protein
MSTEKAIIKMGSNGLQLQNIEDMYRYGQYIVKSGLAPTGLDTPEKVVVALQTGAEIGLGYQASLRSIAVIHGSTSLYGDAALALVRRSGLLSSIKEVLTGEGNEMAAICQVTRKGEAMTEGTFSVADAKTAKLWGKSGPWSTHPKRMLKYKARAFALRDTFPDVLMGLHCYEELVGEAPIPVESTVVEPELGQEVIEVSDFTKPATVPTAPAETPDQTESATTAETAETSTTPEQEAKPSWL